MKASILFTAMIMAFASINGKAQESEKSERTEKAEKKFEELFGREMTSSPTDPELWQNLKRFIFGEVFFVGNLNDRKRELITITLLTTIQTLPQLESHTHAALIIGVTPVEIRESIYQLAPIIGYPMVLNAVTVMNKVFTERGISLPLDPQSTVTEETRSEKGKAEQLPLYGNGMKENMKNLPGEFAEFVPNMLTETLFGDYYTRTGLELEMRELLIFCSLTAMGGAERQMASHALGNLKAGNSKEIMLSAMVQMYPYVGFPRISNAIKVIMEVELVDQ